MNTNGAQIHLLLNHVPVVGYPLLVLTLVWGLWRPQTGVFLYGVYLSILIWASTLASYLSGEGAEDVLRDLPDFDIKLIHTHEDTAFIALIIGSVMAVLALALVPQIQNKIPKLRQNGTQKILQMALLFGAIIVSVILGLAAHQGGLIRHTEIRDAVNL